MIESKFFGAVDGCTLDARGRPPYALTHEESASELKMKQRARKVAAIQFRKRRPRRKATKVEIERVAVESYERSAGAPMMTLEAAFIDLDPVLRAIITARPRRL